MCITAPVHYTSPCFNKNHPSVLTDIKACVQAIGKIERGEFCTSPRITTFLSTVTRYQVKVMHLPGTMNTVSDYGSRHTPNCTQPECQICTFVRSTASAAVQEVSLQDSAIIDMVFVGAVMSVNDIYQGRLQLPYLNRPAWRAIQQECPDYVYDIQPSGIDTGKKPTQHGDMKRYHIYHNVAIIASDGKQCSRPKQNVSLFPKE